MQILTEILRHATGRIDRLYFHLYIDGGDAPIYRERVYCYELYHQMRLLWPPETKYVLNGEVDKAGHPLLRELDADGVKPDFLVHKPGDMSGNYAIIEVKHTNAENDGIRKDLLTLEKFICQVQYKRGIYLFYGDSPSKEIKSKVIGVATNNNININNIELWHHKEIGSMAKQLK